MVEWNHTCFAKKKVASDVILFADLAYPLSLIFTRISKLLHSAVAAVGALPGYKPFHRLLRSVGCARSRRFDTPHTHTAVESIAPLEKVPLQVTTLPREKKKNDKKREKNNLNLQEVYSQVQCKSQRVIIINCTRTFSIYTSRSKSEEFLSSREERDAARVELISSSSTTNGGESNSQMVSQLLYYTLYYWDATTLLLGGLLLMRLLCYSLSYIHSHIASLTQCTLNRDNNCIACGR